MTIELHPNGVAIYADWLDEPVIGPLFEAYWEAVRLRK